MLDINPTTRSASHRMPVDFNSYLLSSSPPASSLELLSFAVENTRLDDRIGHQEGVGQGGGLTYLHNAHAQQRGPSLNERRHGPLKSIIIKQEESADPGVSSGEESEETVVSATSSASSSTPTSPSSPRLKKKVSFADHKGLALVSVKIMSEPSDQPPKLRPEVLASITQGASAGVTEVPSLKLCFSQPASDYLAFRDRLEKDCVSLENVILRDSSIAGTIKVKNVAFHKRVFVRVTCNGWETFEDVQATFVQGPGDSTPHIYDTFAFEFDIPQNFTADKTIQFAVCYEANGHQHWDNNAGNNYQIVSSCPLPTSSPVLTSGHTQWKVNSWPDFACWNHVDTDRPYW